MAASVVVVSGSRFGLSLGTKDPGKKRPICGTLPAGCSPSLTQREHLNSGALMGFYLNRKNIRQDRQDLLDFFLHFPFPEEKKTKNYPEDQVNPV